MAPEAHEASHIFIELGASIVALALLGRLASRIGFSSIPLYLLLGLAFGNGGLAPLNWSADFIHVGAEIGVLLLLFMLGLEYTGEELKHHLSTMLPAGAVDLALNFPPGFVAGLLLGWSPLASVLLGGVTYISSSGIIAKVLAELKRLDQPETTFVVSVLVLEDLAMAIYLPMVAVLLTGGNARGIVTSVSVATGTVGVILFVALRYGGWVSKLFLHESDEITLLTTLGIVILVGGLAERLHVSAAIGAFLVGILSRVQSPKNHTSSWARCAICLLPPSSFSSDWRLTRRRFRP
jgi:CPA2 family monovalent cation:H+ antiporter-2